MLRNIHLVDGGVHGVGACGRIGTPTGLVLDADSRFRYEFAGVVGDRIAANSSGWLTRAPAADPGMLAMFALRDRQPTPNLVPWAGEFVGKYLISAIQAIRCDNDPKLFATVESVIQELIASQADDGYLGPFPQGRTPAQALGPLGTLPRHAGAVDVARADRRRGSASRPAARRRT